MSNPKLNSTSRGSLVVFIKGHLLETVFDKTYFYYFDIDTCNEYQEFDFKIWNGTPTQYLSSKDKITLLHHRGKRLVSLAMLGPVKPGLYSEFLNWCEEIAEKSTKPSARKLQHSISIWKAHILFMLALQSETQTQRKLLKLASVELETLESTEIATHPYIFYLKGLIQVARGKWEEATSLFHQASAYTHNPALYKLLINLYINLDLPLVAKFFENKLRKPAKLDKERMAS